MEEVIEVVVFPKVSCSAYDRVDNKDTERQGGCEGLSEKTRKKKRNSVREFLMVHVAAEDDVKDSS